MPSQFENDLVNATRNTDNIPGVISGAKSNLNKKKIGLTFNNINNAKMYLTNVREFLSKYDSFFKSIDNEFGTKFGKEIDSAKKLITDLFSDLKSVSAVLSKEKIDVVTPFLDGSLQKCTLLESKFSKISTIPYVVDFSTLTHIDWKRIGINGVHYPSKIFLSYSFRNADQTKDDNQKFMDQLIKPLLKLLNIEPITAREHLESNQQIEDDTITLVSDCDGIIGFFTQGDHIENIEHELANNNNVIAICKEEGAKVPSMRRARLQLTFNRNDSSQLLLQLTKALKDKKMFNLVV